MRRGGLWWAFAFWIMLLLAVLAFILYDTPIHP